MKYVLVMFACDTQPQPDGVLLRVPQKERANKEAGMMGDMQCGCGGGESGGGDESRSRRVPQLFGIYVQTF